MCIDAIDMCIDMYRCLVRRHSYSLYGIAYIFIAYIVMALIVMTCPDVLCDDSCTVCHIDSVAEIVECWCAIFVAHLSRSDLPTLGTGRWSNTLLVGGMYPDQQAT